MDRWPGHMQIRGASGNSPLTFGCLFSAHFILTEKPRPLSSVEPGGPQPSYPVTWLSLGANVEQTWEQVLYRVSQPTWDSRKFLLPSGVGTNLLRAWQSNPPNYVLTCWAHLSCRAWSLNDAYTGRFQGYLLREARDKGAGEQWGRTAHAQKEQRGPLSWALLPVIHQIQDSVSHKSPRLLS